jgi:hypothetical protein
MVDEKKTVVSIRRNNTLPRKTKLVALKDERIPKTFPQKTMQEAFCRETR